MNAWITCPKCNGKEPTGYGLHGKQFACSTCNGFGSISKERITSMKPLSPWEINGMMGEIIPDVVVEAVNNLLKKKYRGRAVNLKQDEIIAEIQRLDINIRREKIFEESWMDFESLFEKNGWKVEFDKPGYNETYSAYFTFTPKRNK